jgi:hypothetical protein
MKRPLYQAIASALQAKENCAKSGNTEWHDRHQANIDLWVRNYMPHGSGIDSGTHFDTASTPNKLIFTLGYHHMDEGGSYDGWTDHKAIVTPSLTSRFDLRITGRDRNQIKDYLADTYYEALTQTVGE